MADEKQTPPAQPIFQIQRVYLKDMSLEQPNSPAIFLEQDAPTIEVALDVGAQPLADGVFESTVTATVTAKVGDKVAFLVEGKQAGIFEIRNIPADQLDPLLGIACPNILFPYLRSNIADILTRSGFPPIHLSEVNFEAFYQQRLQAVAEKQTDSTVVAAPTSIN
jgi:preprotein translocase subunit SecB